jgi:chromosome segregation ATPase
MEKTALVLGIIAITAFGFISKTKKTESSKEPIVQRSNPGLPATKSLMVGQPLASAPQLHKKLMPPINERQAKKDTVPGKEKIGSFPSISSRTNDDGKTKTKEIEATSSDGRKYRIKKVNEVLTEFTVDGKEASKEEYAQVIDQIEDAQAEQAQRASEGAQRRREEHDARRKELHERQETSLKEQEEKRERQQEYTEIRKKYEQDREQLSEQRNVLHDSLRKLESLHRRTSSSLNRLNNGTNDEVNSIIADLARNKLITDNQPLSFSLNNNELIVNGAKQPADMHRSLKEKYVHSPGDNFSYSKNGGTTTITINKD